MKTNHFFININRYLRAIVVGMMTLGMSVIAQQAIAQKSTLANLELYCSKGPYTNPENTLLFALDRFNGIRSGDVLVWDNKVYLMYDSPLSAIPGYKDLYNEFRLGGFGAVAIGNDPFNPEVKRFRAMWYIENDSLYLTDVYLFIQREPNARFNDEDLRVFEKFTGVKAARRSEPVAIDETILPLKRTWPTRTIALPAQWLDGSLLVKRRRDGRSIDGETLLLEPYQKLSFKNGRLTNVKEVSNGDDNNFKNMLKQVKSN